MKMAAKSAHTKLLKYYNKVTQVYCITSTLDPHINMEYFQNENWEEQYIKDWTTVMKNIWKKYKPPPVDRISMKYFTDEEAFVNSIYKKRQYITPLDELEQ